MSSTSVLRRVLLVATLAAVVATFAPIAARAQDSADLNVRPAAADRAAARQATNRNRHATSRLLPGVATTSRTLLSSPHRSAALAAAPAAAAAHTVQPSVRYPTDVVYQGGPTVESAESHPVYMLQRSLRHRHLLRESRGLFARSRSQ